MLSKEDEGQGLEDVFVALAGAAGRPVRQHSPILYKRTVQAIAFLMSTPQTEIHAGAGDAGELQLALESEGVIRYVWHGRFGDMLIEVRDGSTFVNGELVQLAESTGVREKT
jgi:hypothetical protein